jgi:peptidoglycan/LPS O-acetylase OafA/YrhL
MPETDRAVRGAATTVLPPAAVAPTRTDAATAIRRSLGPHLDHGFRPDIEGLRAVAVIAVILFHARLLGVHGGFVGVDVFFVLSGFLITRLILGELVATGRLRLRTFWGRRARRLLAASALVLVVTAIASHVILPPLNQGTVAVDVAAAATFTSNFVFASRLGGYFGAQLGQAAPSPVLHFWSLSVEEQFYLCWPLLLALLTRRPRQYRRLLLTAIGVFGVGGFVLAAWMTPRSPTWAFYLLPTRMGELLAGALLAVLGSQVRRIAPATRAGLAWLGLAVVVVVCFRFDEQMSWPGTAVLIPVLATMAVIVGGSAEGAAWAPVRALGTGGLQWVGRHSYALYLWHWPILVFAEARGGPLGWPARVVAITMAVGLSALSYRFVEGPVRHNRWLAALPGRSLALGAAMILAGLTAAWGLWAAVPSFDGGQVASAPQLAPLTPSPTTAAAPATTAAAPEAAAPAGTDAAPTTTGVPVAPDLTSSAAPLDGLVASLQQALAVAAQPAPVPSNLRPSLGAARDHALPYDQDCVNVGRDQALKPCFFGVEGAPRSIVLYGDSHAVQWFEPLQMIAQQRGYQLVVLAKGGCPVTDVTVKTPILKVTCPPWRDAAIEWIAEHQPSLVVAADSYTQYDDDASTWAAGADTTMARLAAAAPHVIVIGDNPTSTTDPPSCLSANTGNAASCATTRERAVRTDRIAGEADAARAHGITFVDTTDWFCTPTTCPVVVGDLLVLRDQTHLTPPMAEFLAPLLDSVLAPVLTAAG